MPRVPREFTEKTKFCSVCGKSIPYYVRICDRCGSIQRPVGGDGQPLPPDQTKPCDHCGKPVPKSDRLCPECEEESRPQFAGLSGGKGPRVAAATFGVFGVAGVGAGIWALLVMNGITLGAVLLGISALVVVISTGAYFAIRSSSAKRAVAEAGKSEDSDDTDENSQAEAVGSAPGGPSDSGD